MDPLTLDLTTDELDTLAGLPHDAKRQTAYRVAGACPHRWGQEYGRADTERAIVADSPNPYATLGTALDELERQDKSTALITLCIGGGMGVATIIERV